MTENRIEMLQYDDLALIVNCIWFFTIILGKNQKTLNSVLRLMLVGTAYVVSCMKAGDGVL